MASVEKSIAKVGAADWVWRQFPRDLRRIRGLPDDADLTSVRDRGPPTTRSRTSACSRQSDVCRRSR